MSFRTAFSWLDQIRKLPCVPIRSISASRKVEVRKRVNDVDPLSMLKIAALLSYRVATPLKCHLLVWPHTGVIRHRDTRRFKIDEVQRIGQFFETLP